ncbi:MAG: VLRF1 family aeRF1-type release factor [Chloroflexota bacterium]
MLHLEDVKELIGEAGEPTLTLYVNIDPALSENQAGNPAWRIWLKNTLKQLDARVKPKQRPMWEHLHQQAEAYFEHFQPDSKSLALFITPDTQIDYPLPVAVENESAFGKPLVTPLLWAIDEYEPYLIVMVDHEKARFLVTYLGSVGYQETATLELDTSDWAHKTSQNTSGAVDKMAQSNARDDFEKRVEHFTEQFYRDIAHRAVKLAAEQKARRIILAGDEQAAHAVHDCLPETMTSSVVAVLPIPMRAHLKEILEHAAPAALAFEREEEIALVNQIVDMAKAGGRAALGRKAVTAALNQHRVELLVASWPPADGDKTADLALQAFASGGQIELVHGEAADHLNDEGGLAAQLYYAL